MLSVRDRVFLDEGCFRALAFTLLLGVLTLSGCGGGAPASPSPPALTSSQHPLPEQYIWFSSVSPDGSSPRYFRKTFLVSERPAHATLYLMGPYFSDIYLNGALVNHYQPGASLVADRPVVIVDISSGLLQGSNTLAVQASQSSVLVVKVVPAAQGLDMTPLTFSDATWKGATSAPGGWELSSFDDSTWANVQSLGSIESDFHYFQGNFDLGMYQWPAYEGLSAILDHSQVVASSVLNVSPNGATFSDPSVLTSSSYPQKFQVTLPASSSSPPSLLLDFGKEITGRLEIASSSDQPIQLQMNFGESLMEATAQNTFLSTRTLLIPPLATVHGPLTAFRFVQVVFLSGPLIQSFDHISADQVFRQAAPTGSFTSSDPVLNEVWQVSAYTEQVNVQSLMWDAPKRDRNSYSGDLFIEGRTNQVTLSQSALLQQSLTDTLTRSTPDLDNTPPYDAYWVLAVEDQYQFTGDLNFLRSNQANLISLLDLISSELVQNLYQRVDPTVTVFADWSPGMIEYGSAAPAEASRITTLLFVKALNDGAWLLSQLGDTAHATQYQQTAANVTAAAITAYQDPATQLFGSRVQTNAMAVFSGVADPNATANIYSQVLAVPAAQPVSPYFNYFVLESMAQAGHRPEALDFIRQYWGGMLNVGATTFFEIWDPSFASGDWHANMTNFFNSVANQGSSRYFVSLAHGWSSGPAPWLHEQILGITPYAPGFKTIQLRPDLAGLQYASGSESTPQGIVSIDISNGGSTVQLDLPINTDANVSLPTSTQNRSVIVNGASVSGTLVENNTRTLIYLPTTGTRHFVLQSF